MAITDHDCVSSYVKIGEHISKRRKENPDTDWGKFKVIYGNEIYLCRNGLTQQNFVRGEDKYFHFILLAKNSRGNQQIRELSTRAWERSYMYFHRRVPTYFQDLEEIIQREPGNVIASSACFRAGTQVETRFGWKNIEDIQQNDEVFNRYGEWEKVNYPTSRDFNGTGYELELRGNKKKIVCTDNHKFLVITNKGRTPRWVAAKDLNTKMGGSKHILLSPTKVVEASANTIKKEEWENSYLPYFSAAPRRKRIKKEFKLTPEVMRFFGLFLGDGCVSLTQKRKSVSVHFNIEEFETYWDSFVYLASQEIGIEWNIFKRPELNRVDISSSASDIIDLFYYLFGDVKANTKCVPDRLRISKKLDQELVFGYMLADGYFRGREKDGYNYGEFVTASVSQQLSNDIWEILNSLQIRSSIYLSKGRIDKNNINHQNAWYISGSIKSFGKVKKNMKYSPAQVEEIFSQAREQSKHEFLIHEKTLYRKIRIAAKSKIALNETVYCLNNNTHSFKVEDVIVHNCLGGQLPFLIMKAKEYSHRPDMKEAYEQAIIRWVEKIQSIFGKENFYFELQPALSDEQIHVNKELLKLSKVLNVKCIITTDAHYLEQGGREIHKAYLNSKEGEREVDAFYEATYLMKSSELWARMSDYIPKEDFEQMLQNTLNIGVQCEDYDILKPLHLPYIPREHKDQTLQSPIKTTIEETPNFFKFYNSHELADKQLAIRIHNYLTDPKTHGNYFDNFKVADYELGIIWESGLAQNTSWSRYLVQMADYCDIIWNEGDSLICPSRGCFTPDSKVLLGTGEVTNIQDVKITDKVISHNGNINNVLDILKYTVKEEMSVIKPKGGEEIVCTKDHRFYIKTCDPCKNTIYQFSWCKERKACPRNCSYRIPQENKWVEAKDLRVGDMISYPKPKFSSFLKEDKVIDLAQAMVEIKKTNIDYDEEYIWITNGKAKNKKIKRFVRNDKNFNYFIGVYIGDGWTRQEGWESGLAFHKKNDIESKEFCKKYIETILGISVTEVESKNKSLTQLKFYSAIWGNILKYWCGKNTYEKHVPEFLIRDNKDNIIGLIKGLMDSDGCYLKSKTISICYDSVNYNLISQVKMLFAYLGCYGNIKARKYPNNPAWKTSYRWNASGKQLLKLKEILPKIHVPKQKYYRNDFLEDSNNFYSIVESVGTRNYEGEVYDLTVERDSSYVINNCGVHNSAGASYVMYALGIIQIDKTREKAPLLFERFMNPERASVLDVDIDVESTKRNRVIAAMQAVYGEDRVVRVCTFKTEKAKSAILAAGRGLGIDIDTTRYIASLIGSERGLQHTLHDMYYGNEEKELNPSKVFIQEVNKYPKLWSIAQRIEGLINGVGIHAGGIIILDEPLTNRCAIMATTKGIPVSSFDLHDAEKTGLIKIDLLATEGLSKIRTTLDLLVEYDQIDPEATLKETYEKVVGIYNIERHDPKMWEMVWNNEIISLFQMEQQSGIQGIALAKPKSLEDLATINSVMRLMASERGAEQPLNKYARFRENPTAWDQEMIRFGLTTEERMLLHRVLDYSSGICAHQEDLYTLLTHPEIAGWSLGKADQVRKAVAKKNPKEYSLLEEEYFTGAKEKELSSALTNYVWNVLVATQRGYSFNLAHTLSYSLIGLQEMNLAYKYPIIFWNTANLIIDSGSGSFDIDEEEDDENEEENRIIEDLMVEESTSVVNYGKIASAIGKMQNYGIKVLPPNINKSHYTFTPDVATNSIMYGIKGIVRVGDKVVDEIIEKRPYTSPDDFLERVKVNKPQMVNLIKSGAFEDFKPRRQLMEEYINDICGKKTVLNLRNANMLIVQNLIPDKYDLQRRVFNFNKYLRKLKEDDTFYFDDIAFNFYSQHFNMDLLREQDGVYTILASAWKKIYDSHMDKIRTYIKDNHDELLDNLNNQLFLESWTKYALGSDAKWSMDSVCFYQDEHELDNMNAEKYGIDNFFELPPEPTVNYSFTTKDGKVITLYNTHLIAGTVIDRDKMKSLITLLTPQGVVSVKAYGIMPQYDKQISAMQSDGTKKVIEKSWFSRGNKIIVQGMKRDEQTFFAKRYRNSPGHHFMLIEEVLPNGDLIIQEERIELEGE